MAHVNVTIAGKTYRMACAEGEESHLSALAEGFDARIEEMRKAFGEIGDMRLHVMAALTVSDELAELRRKVEAQAAEIESLRARTDAFDADRAADQTRIAEAVGGAAGRIEQLSKTLMAPRG